MFPEHNVHLVITVTAAEDLTPIAFERWHQRRLGRETLRAWGTWGHHEEGHVNMSPTGLEGAPEFYLGGDGRLQSSTHTPTPGNKEQKD